MPGLTCARRGVKRLKRAPTLLDTVFHLVTPARKVSHLQSAR